MSSTLSPYRCMRCLLKSQFSIQTSCPSSVMKNAAGPRLTVPLHTAAGTSSASASTPPSSRLSMIRNFSTTNSVTNGCKPTNFKTSISNGWLAGTLAKNLCESSRNVSPLLLAGPGSRRLFSMGGKRRVSSFLETQNVFTKDRLILVSCGILVVGGMVAFDKNQNKSRRNSANVRKIHMLSKAAQEAVNNESYEEALKFYEQAKKLLEVVETNENVQQSVLLRICEQLGHIAYNLETWEEAYEYIKESQVLMEKLHTPENDIQYLENLMMRAKLDGMFGRQEDALERFNRCIAMLEEDISIADLQAPGSSERLTLYGMVLHEFGTYTKEMGLLGESEASFSKALNIAKVVLGPRHEQTSVIANDLATVYDEEGRYNKAERLATKAIKIASETSPENLATYKYNLGSILLHKGDIQRARQVLNDALAIAEENEDSELKKIIESSVIKLDVQVS